MYLYLYSSSAFFITKVNFKGIAFPCAFNVDLCYKTVKKVHSTINSRAHNAHHNTNEKEEGQHSSCISVNFRFSKKAKRYDFFGYILVYRLTKICPGVPKLA